MRHDRFACGFRLLRHFQGRPQGRAAGNPDQDTLFLRQRRAISPGILMGHRE